MSLLPILQKLDNWSDKTIKSSFIGKVLSCFSHFPLLSNSKFLTYFQKPLYITLILSVSGLFIALTLPQFAQDRFGIGIIILFCFATFLLNIFFKRITLINFNSLDLFIILFLIISFISTFSSFFLKESLIGFLKYLTLFLYYFLIKSIILNSSKKIFSGLFYVLFISAVVVTLIGINQYIIGVKPLATWEDPTYGDIHTRVYSTLGNPNLLANYLLLILPISLTFPFEIKANLFYKMLFIFISFLILLCLIFTGSRGGYLGLVFSCIGGLSIFLSYVILQTRLTKQFYKIIFLILTLLSVVYLLLTYLFPDFLERIATIFLLRDYSSNNYRINVWLSCLTMLKDNWLIGIGPGNSTFLMAYGLYMMSGFHALAAYNIFLELAIETGIIGSLIFILIFLTALLKSYCLFKEKGSILALGIFISLISLLAQGMVDTTFFRPQVSLPFWFLLASIGKLESKSQGL